MLSRSRLWREKDLEGLRINASEGSGFSDFSGGREILRPAPEGAQNDKKRLGVGVL